MAYAYVTSSSNGVYNGAAGTTITLSVTYASGESGVLVANCDAASGGITLSDGTNTYTRIGSITACNGVDYGCFVCLNPTPGTYTVTATFVNSQGDRSLSIVGKYTGLSTLQAGGISEQFGSSTAGTDALVSSSYAPTSQPAAFISVVTNGNNVTLTGGTTFSDRGERADGGGIHHGLEDKRITSTSSLTATWTNTGTSPRCLFTFAVSENAPTANKPFSFKKLLIATLVEGVALAPSGTLNLQVTASVSSGTAPLYVHFDATATTSTNTAIPFHEVYYIWSFGESTGPGVTTWSTGAKAGVNSRNVAYGPMAGHVFETPSGTAYTVTCIAYDGVSTASVNVSVTVNDPDVVFSGTNTVCVSTAGNFTGAPSGASQVTIGTASYATAMSNKGDGKRLLFRRGESWDAAAQEIVAYNTSTGGQIGAFGIGADPIIKRKATYTAQDATMDFSSATTPNMANWIVYGLFFDHSLISIDSHYAIGQSGGIDRLLLLRCTGKATGRVFLNPSNVLNIYNSGGHPGHHIWDQLAIVDCATNSIPIGSPAPATNTWPYGSYVSADRCYFAGNNFDLAGGSGEGTSHCARFPYAGKLVLSNNTMARAGYNEHCFKVAAPVAGSNAVEENGLGQGSSRWILCSDNDIKPAYGGGPLSFGPESDSVAELVKDCIIERNWFRFSQVPIVSGIGIQMHGPYMTARNNLVDMTLCDFLFGISVAQRGTSPAPVPDHCYVYNNSIFYADTDSDFYGIDIDAGVTNTIVKNNLCYAPNDSNHVSIYDIGTGTVVSNNTLDAQVNTNPKFSGALTAYTGWKITDPTSYTKNAGATVPVYEDFFNATRTAGSMDIGASEQ